jgi:hypothetical protein
MMTRGIRKAGRYTCRPETARPSGLQGHQDAVHVHPGGEEGVFAYGDEPQLGQLPSPWTPERFATPEILKFNEEFAVEILPETD